MRAKISWVHSLLHQFFIFRKTCMLPTSSEKYKGCLWLVSCMLDTWTVHWSSIFRVSFFWHSRLFQNAYALFSCISIHLHLWWGKDGRQRIYDNPSSISMQFSFTDSQFRFYFNGQHKRRCKWVVWDRKLFRSGSNGLVKSGCILVFEWSVVKTKKLLMKRFVLLSEMMNVSDKLAGAVVWDVKIY